ncbi:MAG: substrate-binding domain-containing protein [Lachnospiraceae bacterium]|jgi:Ca-activated chloride channel family protein
MSKKASISILLIFLILLSACGGIKKNNNQNSGSKQSVFGTGGTVIRIVSGSENKELEPLIEQYCKKNKVTIEMTYMGSVDIMRQLQADAANYDAVWPASSIWISMGDRDFKVKHTESISLSPVVFGIKKSLAESLGFVGKEVSINDIMSKISSGELKFCMTSATQSNSGAGAYLGFLSGLSGNPEVLTEEDLQKPQLKEDITNLLSGVDRSSGSSEWLKTLFLNGDYDSMVNYESLIITTNQELIARGEEPLYLVYPYDGLSISDSPLGYIDRGDKNKEEAFLDFQKYLLSEEIQSELQKLGRRTGYEGVFDENEGVFKKEWGIDTDKILSPIKLPTADVIMEALNLYQGEFRKPSLSIYCLDFSGSMTGKGEREVKEAMDLILDQKKAKDLLLQANPAEVNQVIFFNSNVIESVIIDPSTEEALNELNKRIKNQSAGGGTDMYRAMIEGLITLGTYDLNKYNPAIILLTDGESGGSFNDFKAAYKELGQDIPVFSIMFGDANPKQLKEIAEYTGARVFDGRENLAGAFRNVKGYN